jgi:hypothetical protein
MIKRSTWIWVLLLAFVATAYILLKNHPVTGATGTPTATETGYLITPADGTLQSIQIKASDGTVFRMQRDLQKVWVITSPSQGEADQGLASAAETQVGALKIIAVLGANPDLNAMQLATPADTIDLAFISGRQHKIELGGLSPTSSGYYVRFDSQQVFVVSQSGIEALLNLLKSPPYPVTATPQESPTMEPGATATP